MARCWRWARMAAVAAHPRAQLAAMQHARASCVLACPCRLPCPAVDDVLKVLARGAANRHVGETKMNQESSR